MLTVPLGGNYSTSMFDHGEAWWYYLAHYSRRITHYLEVGSFEGQSARWMLENVLVRNGSKATCIDPWEPYGDSKQELNPSWDTFHSNVKPFSDRVTALRGTSRHWLRRLDRDFDVVYIDGGHFQYEALEDCVLAWPLLKVGGYMIMDDVGTPTYEERHARLGVESFLATYGPKLKVLSASGAWQVVLKKLKE